MTMKRYDVGAYRDSNTGFCTITTDEHPTGDYVFYEVANSEIHKAFNRGVAQGMEAGKILFGEQKMEDDYVVLGEEVFPTGTELERSVIEKHAEAVLKDVEFYHDRAYNLRILLDRALNILRDVSAVALTFDLEMMPTIHLVDKFLAEIDGKDFPAPVTANEQV